MKVLYFAVFQYYLDKNKCLGAKQYIKQKY